MLQATAFISEDDLKTIKHKANVNIELPAKFTYLEDVGAIHNGALEVASTKKLAKEITLNNNLEGEAFNNLLINSLGDKINDIDKTTLNASLLKIVQDERFIADYQAIVCDAIVNNGLSDELEIQTTPQIKDEFSLIGDKIMKLFEDAYMRYPDKMEDYDFLINEYIRIIEASDELTDEEKEAIYTGFSVAAYTARFWNEQSREN